MRFVRFSCVRHPVDILYVSVDVRSTLVVERLTSGQQNNLRSKPCLIIITDVNMTSKRAVLQKVTVLLNLTTEKKVLLE